MWVLYTHHRNLKPSITGSWSSPCPHVPEWSDVPPAKRSLDLMFHKQSRDSKSFKSECRYNKPLSVYSIGIKKCISCSFSQYFKNNGKQYGRQTTECVFKLTPLEVDRNIAKTTQTLDLCFWNRLTEKVCCGKTVDFWGCYVILITQSRPLLQYPAKGFSPQGPTRKSDQSFFSKATSKGLYSMSNYLVFCLLVFSFSSVDRPALTV